MYPLFTLFQFSSAFAADGEYCPPLQLCPLSPPDNDLQLYLAEHEDKLIILDEVHRVPNLFQPLRGLIDQGRRRGRRAGRFLLLGSASMDLLRQSGETLAGRRTLGD